MRLFDLHCDTLYECERGGFDLYKNNLAVSLSSGSDFNKWAQCFAIWMPDELRGKKAVNHFNRVYEFYINQLRKHSEYITPVLSGSDLDPALGNAKCLSVLTVEGGSACAGSLDVLRDMYRLGVRVMTLTWNGANEIGCGVGAGCSDGLTDFGVSAVREMERLGMIVDVSHLNDAGFFHICDIAEKPFIATHSNARAICGHKRNLTDGQIKIIASRGGIIGLNLYTEFLSGSRNAGLDEIYAHVSHFLSLGCEDVLCIGSDFDGADTPYMLSQVQDMQILAEYLQSRNIPDIIIGKIFYDNAHKFMISHI